MSCPRATKLTEFGGHSHILAEIVHTTGTLDAREVNFSRGSGEVLLPVRLNDGSGVRVDERQPGVDGAA